MAELITQLICVVSCSCAKPPTTKAEPPPTRDVGRDSGTDSANGGSGDFHEKAVKGFGLLFRGT